jgi:nucleoside-triphosphatase THEP1
MEMVYRTHPLYRICITGGPCGGKTSCMKIIRDHFMSKGFNVFSVPEIATFTVIGGGSINCGEM